MQFSTKEDLEAPIASVFAVLSDFEMFERSAVRRGADVQRIGDHATPEIGQAWQAAFQMRGKNRDAKVTLTQYAPPSDMVFESRSDGLSTTLQIALVALSPRRTRISVQIDVAPQSLPARLFVQSLKLAKSTLTKRFRLRVADYSKDIEERALKLG